MPQPHAEVTDIVVATPEVLYAILSDYVGGHPHIVPKQYFSDFVVEQGGKGAGTVVQLPSRAFGVKNKMRLIVSEPEPARVLVEDDDKKAFSTSFTLTPRENGKKTELRIATDWKPKPGILGFIESITTPPPARMIYKKEMKVIQEYVKKPSR